MAVSECDIDSWPQACKTSTCSVKGRRKGGDRRMPKKVRQRNWPCAGNQRRFLVGTGWGDFCNWNREGTWERTECEKWCIDCRGTESVHAPGLKGLLRGVPTRKYDCGDQVVQDGVAKIFEALVRSAGNGKMWRVSDSLEQEVLARKGVADESLENTKVCQRNG